MSERMQAFQGGDPILVTADYSRNQGNYGQIVSVSGIANWYEVLFPDGDREYLHGGMIRIAGPAKQAEPVEKETA